MKDRSVQVKAYVPVFVKELIEKIASERKLNQSELIGNMLVKQLADGHYDVLTKTEVKYVDLKKIEIETNMLKYIRSKSAEKINFLKNIKKQMYLFTLNKKDIDRRDIVENMKVSLQIAQANKWTNEVSKIKEFLKKVKVQDYELNHEIRQIEVLYDKKKNIQNRMAQDNRQERKDSKSEL